jgi:uncharacterized membrane protein YbaN (DUF454 family)
VFLGIGFVSLALGLVGLFLPIVPTVPFLVVSVWAFQRSDKRLERWLLRHKKVGAPLRLWKEHGAISRRSKLIATLTMGAGAVGAIFTLPWLVGKLVLWSLLLAATVFVWTRPSGPAKDAASGAKDEKGEPRPAIPTFSAASEPVRQ